MTDTTIGDLGVFVILGLMILGALFIVLPEIKEMQKEREQAISECVQYNIECLEAVNYSLEKPRCVCYV